MRYVHPAVEVARYVAETFNLRLRSDIERDTAKNVALQKQRELSRERYGSWGVKDLLKRRDALRAIKYEAASKLEFCEVHLDNIDAELIRRGLVR